MTDAFSAATCRPYDYRYGKTSVKFYSSRLHAIPNDAQKAPATSERPIPANLPTSGLRNANRG